MTKSIVVAVVSDIHSGSKVAVCPPRITLDEGDSYVANKWQLWLWNNWLDYWKNVKLARGKGKKRLPLVVVINGEITDGDHHRTTQGIAPRSISDRFKIAIETLNPMLDLNPDEIYVIRGTETHSGKGGEEDELIAKDISAVQSHTESFSWWHLPLEVKNILFDIAHHGKTGNLPWTGASAVVRYAVELSYYYLSRGHRLPDLAIRSHKHKSYDSYDNAPIRVITTCGWQYPTSFIHKIAPGQMPDIGGLIFTCQKKEYLVRKVVYKPRPSTVQVAMKKNS